MNGKVIIVSLCLVFMIFSSGSEAFETAERITDKEIIERLTILEEGQKGINKRFDDMNDSMNQRFVDMNSSMNQRFVDMNNSVNQRFDDMNNSINKRFDDMNDSMNQRFDDMMTLLQILITVMLIVGGGLLGWMIIIWRKLIKVEERQSKFETQDEEIKFLKEVYIKLNDMVVKIMDAVMPGNAQSQKL